jgi:hypothetical protein
MLDKKLCSYADKDRSKLRIVARRKNLSGKSLYRQQK